ncbi:MAG: glycosyl hydrolase family 65 protein, partial [Oscillospiraceae bacterium]
YVADYEHHVTAAVAFGGMNYFNITQDEEFFNNKGIEIFLETARFWVSRLTYNKEEDRYEIHQVTGPDEWHEPVNNSIYTNYLARWNILKALDVLADYRVNKPDVFKRATQKIGLTDAETATWGEKANKIFVRNKTGVIEQFDGYFDLKNEVITKWDENGMPIRPEAFKGMSLRKTCILKQADIVMLMFLMQYEFDLETQKANFEYYEQRTLHRSSLSPSIHGLMGLRVGDTKRAYSYLERSAYVDITNNQGNTREGIHAASTGGTWQCITLGYCGMSVNEDGMLCFTPKLPEKWTEVDYTISRQGCKLRVNITKDDAVVIIEDGNAEVKYLVNGQERIAKHA